MPNNSYARFLLISFHFFSIIIRTGYLAKQFDFMQTDLRKPNMERLSQVIEKKYTIHVLENHFRKFWNIFNPFSNSGTYLSISEENYNDPRYIMNLLREGSDQVFFTDDVHVNLLRQQSNFTIKFTKLQEVILSDHIGFCFSWNHFLHEAFDRKLGHMIDSGITKKILEDASTTERKIDFFGPIVLTMDHLDVVFQIWLAGLATATLEFLLEHFAYWISKHFYKQFLSKINLISEKFNVSCGSKFRAVKSIVKTQSNIVNKIKPVLCRKK